jgi:hypothetical protein
MADIFDRIAEQQQGDVFDKISQQSSLGTTPPKLGFWSSLAKAGTSSLPAIGGVVGGVVGAPLGLPGVVGGTAGGAGIGASLQKVIEQTTGLSEPEPTGQQFADIGMHILYGGLSPAGGQVGAKTALGVLGNKLSPTMQKVNVIAKEAGIAPSISMLRPESKTASLYDALIGKLPLANLLQRSSLSKTIAKTGEYAKDVSSELFETSIKASKAKQGQLYQQAIDMLPERISMPNTIKYIQNLLKPGNVSDLVTSIKNNQELANLSPEVMEDIIKTAVKNFKPTALNKSAVATLNGFLQSVDEAGTVSREMLGTLKANLGSSKVGKVIQKELNRIMRSEMPEEAAKLWQQADEAYAYLSKLKPIEDIFKASFSTKKGFNEFNPANYIKRYEQAISDDIIPATFRSAMDKLKVLAELSTESAKRKAEFSMGMEIFGNLLGVTGLASYAYLGDKYPALAMAGSALMLARSSTAKRGIIRRLATSGVVSKEMSMFLGDVAGKYGTIQLSD